MSFFVDVTLLAAVGYAMSRQAHRREVPERHRFALAVGYAIVGLGLCLTAPPHRAAATLLLAVGVVGGLACGLLTSVWMTPDGLVWRRGSRRTMGLLGGIVAATGWLVVHVDLQGVHGRSGYGAVSLAMAITLAIQAELIHLRALTLIRAVGRVELSA